MSRGIIKVKCEEKVKYLTIWNRWSNKNHQTIECELYPFIVSYQMLQIKIETAV